MHKFFCSKNYKIYSMLLSFFVIVCTILIIVLPTIHTSIGMPEYIGDINYTMTNSNIALYEDIQYVFSIYTDPIYNEPQNIELKNFYTSYLVGYIFVIIGLIVVFTLGIIKIFRSHYLIHFFIPIFLLPIIIVTPYNKTILDETMQLLLSNPTITYPYNSYLYVGYYFTIFFFAINTIIGIIEFIYRKDIPEYNIDIRKYLPKFRIKVKPHKPTNKERIAELEQQVQDLQDKLNNQE